MAFDKYTQFQKKTNASFYGDPNGSFIMAEDINLIQDSVTQLEQTIGINSNNLSISERIKNMEQNAALRADKFIVYQGNPLLAYETLNEAIHSFSFVEHLVLERQGESSFETLISEIIKGRTNVYGYIDCTSTIALSSIQLEIEWWRTQGAIGIYLANFDYENGNTRERQNDLLLSVHERGLHAVVTGDINNVLFNAENELNPDWTALGLTENDGYHVLNLFVQSSTKNSYDSVLAKAKELIRAKESLGISIYVEDTGNGSQGATQSLYEHGHGLTLLFGFDGYFLNRTDFYQLNDPIRYHAWAPFLGAWGDGNITLVETISDVRRRTSFGEIIYVKSSNTIVYTGLTIPPEILQWKDNSLPGTVIQDGTIPDSKIESYDGDRLIQSINQSSGEEKISLSQVEDIMVDGGFSVDLLKTATIESINVRTEEDIENGTTLVTINNNALGTLSVENMSGNVVSSINNVSGHASVGNAYIHGSIIDELDGSALKSGDIDADRMAANVIDAINKGWDTNKKIDSMYVGDLRADRMQAEVITAINLYAKSGVFDKVSIESAAIGELEARNIQTAVIGALEANIGHATINSALIGELTANHIQTAVIDALEANVGYATINSALIGQLEARHIQADIMNALKANIGKAVIDNALIGELEAKHIQASVIDALEANVGIATINSALIGQLRADQIETIVIDALKANIGTATIDSALIGELEARSIETAVIDAIKANIGTAVIDSAIIGELTAAHMKGKVVEAINLSAAEAVIDGAKIKEASIGTAHIIDGSIDNAKIGSAAIKTANIELGAVTSAIIGEGQVKTINIAQASITDALIDSLSASKINAGTINSSLVKIQGDNGFLRLWGNRLQVFDDQAIPVERVALGDVNADGTVFGFRVRGADGQTVLYDEKGVYNEGITDGAITNPKIGDDAVDGRVIQAESIFARHIVSDQILADHIAAQQINGDHILAGSITAGSAIIANGAIGRAQLANAVIGSAQIDNAVISNGHIKDLNADKIVAGKVKAQFVEIGGDTHFLEGYDPVEVNASIRDDLRLVSALPTNITLDSAGIKATTVSDPTKFVSLDYRGLYVSNGAIVIDGGLTKDNIDSNITEKWDEAAQFSDDMSSDNVLTANEKRSLQREWDGYVAEHVPIMTQVNYYWPDELIVPDAKADYVNKYNNLNTYLNVTPDNNGSPILDVSNIVNNSIVVGTELSDAIVAYKNAKFELQRVIAQHAKDLADEAQRNIDEIEGKLTHSVEVISSNGNIFRNGQINTTLEAIVRYGSEDITSTINASQLIWTRKSIDSQADIVWNTAHSGGAKTIVITASDIQNRATFSCQLVLPD